MYKLNFFFASLFVIAISYSVNAESIGYSFDRSIPQVSFAVKELKKSVQNTPPFINGHFTFDLNTSCCTAEGYTIERKGTHFTISAADANGLMYGGLELAERIRLRHNLSKITTISDKPHIVKRGIKFNIPLDVRTSSFDDSGDAAQNNIGEMWNFNFWVEFFDNMAKHRFNAISFWNAHPFSSMVKLKDYPDVALQDVAGTTVKPQENPHYWSVPELPSIKIVNNLKIIKKMTIEEKIIFWQRVTKYARNRGIEVYFITWNIALNGAALPGSNKEVGDKKGKYGISNDFKNRTSVDYLRKSVKQFLINYPDVTGIGVTAGENMRNPMTDDDKEKWLWETYGLGIQDAKREQPNREIKFIHRFWWTDMDKIMKYWGDYPDQFDMSFKYAKARLYSAPNPSFHESLLDWMKPQKLKSWWNLRNDDIFIHRWGDPSYVSRFIKNMPIEQTAGFHMGSDGYVWGREFISKNPEVPRQLEINKHWFRFMLWGRLGYNPNIPEQRFAEILGSKFPETDAPKLLNAWSTASKIIPQINRFHWQDWDYMWSPEACTDIWNNIKDINKFRIAKTMKGSGILNPVDYVEQSIANVNITQITPLNVADNLSNYSDKSLEMSKVLLKPENTKELKNTLLDIQGMSHLGHYYANKIRAAVALEFFKKTGHVAHKAEAVQLLQLAVNDWVDYAKVNSPRYKRQNFARLRTFDFDEQLHWVKQDVIVAQEEPTYEHTSLTEHEKAY